MPISAYISKREYIVTVQDFQDLDSIYDDLETHGKSPASVDLSRSVECVHRRPTSRNTHYLLTDWEAADLAKDSRIKSVTLAPHYLGIQAGTFATTQTSTAWDKSTSTSSSMKNWGLLRCTEGTQRSGWGGTGYNGDGVGTAAQTSTITLTQTGRNVDVVVCDLNGIVWDHPEYAVNADGTGGSRAVQYNWYQHNSEVYPGNPSSTYSYGTGDHSTHVAGTIAGNTQGWARSANIYNLYYDTGNPGNFSYVFDYIRAFHRNKNINLTTGRKNPTIVNNSWGESIFPSEWTFSDITAVTYRGVRHTPSGAITYNGVSGVCTANTKLADLVNFENGGNRITTTGPYVPPGGSILTKPTAWTQEGQEAFLTAFTAPDSQYTLTVQGPADISFISDVAADAISGTMNVQVEVVVKQGPTVINTYIGPLSSTTNGGTIESIVEELTVNLTDATVYTIEFNTTLDTAGAGADLLVATAMRLTVITDAVGAGATVAPISDSLLGAASLTASTTPTVGNSDDGYWTLNLPFNIEYLGTSYSTIYVSTNHYLTFGGGSTVWNGISVTTPNLPKIMWCSADNSAQRIYYGVEGTAPNRTYRVRLEGNGGTAGTLGSPGMVCEYVFYENAIAQIDLITGVNNRKTAGSGFTTQQLNDWGFISGQRIPARVPACDVDLEDLYAEGIIMVGAAGNGRWKHDVPGGADWNNSFEMANRYPDSVNTPYFYMRGTSPTANDNLTDGEYELPSICVGSVDSIQIDQKVQYSDCGPGVDIWAPGTHIISSLPSGTSDSRNSSYYLGKYSGTSMASPQVCGILACALEVYPHWNQQAAKRYIKGIAKSNQLTATTGGPTDAHDLQGAPNLFLYYKKEIPASGTMFPRSTYNERPSTGTLYPRPKIITGPITIGSQEYTTPGSYSWTCPSGVTSVCVVAIGGGASGCIYGGGGGGGLGWKNNIAVTPGQTYTVVVGAGGISDYFGTPQDGGDSYFIDTTTVKGGGGMQRRGNFYEDSWGYGGTYVGDGGGDGGRSRSGNSFINYYYYGGGGAGGYTGNGGVGGEYHGQGDSVAAVGQPGQGGGGAGGHGIRYADGTPVGDGGGVGIYGIGTSGTTNGEPGSGGTGKLYGGGAQGASESASINNGISGGGGAVRIIWGLRRSFPSNAA